MCPAGADRIPGRSPKESGQTYMSITVKLRANQIFETKEKFHDGCTVERGEARSCLSGAKLRRPRYSPAGHRGLQLVAEKCVLKRRLGRLAVTISACLSVDHCVIGLRICGRSFGRLRGVRDLADDQVRRVVDQVAIQVEDLAGAVGVAEHVAGDGP